MVSPLLLMEMKRKQMLEAEKRRVQQQRKTIDSDFPSVVVSDVRDSALIDDELFMTRKPKFVMLDDINW